MKVIEFHEVEKFLSKEEFNEYLALSFSGSLSYDSKGIPTITMGMEAYKALEDFRNRMVEKYKNEVISPITPKMRGPKFTPPKKKHK